jgi:hypothetical protein
MWNTWSCWFYLPASPASQSQSWLRQTGSLSGQVKDEKGAILLNATVILRNVGTNQSRTTQQTPTADIVSRMCLPVSMRSQWKLVALPSSSKWVLIIERRR